MNKPVPSEFLRASLDTPSQGNFRLVAAFSLDDNEFEADSAEVTFTFPAPYARTQQPRDVLDRLISAINAYQKALFDVRPSEEDGKLSLTFIASFTEHYLPCETISAGLLTSAADVAQSVHEMLSEALNGSGGIYTLFRHGEPDAWTDDFFRLFASADELVEMLEWAQGAAQEKELH